MDGPKRLPRVRIGTMRDLLMTLLLALLCASLVNSVSLRNSHAAVTVAPSAAEFRPLAPGDMAPRFIAELQGPHAGRSRACGGENRRRLAVHVDTP